MASCSREARLRVSQPLPPSYHGTGAPTVGGGVLPLPALGPVPLGLAWGLGRLLSSPEH